ncbi:MAG: Ig domain-containing protein [Lachnospiraceae bacterium]|nr:Ig domain-containing protein [Lachnospiraceae bacterium]
MLKRVLRFFTGALLVALLSLAVCPYTAVSVHAEEESLRDQRERLEREEREQREREEREKREREEAERAEKEQREREEREREEREAREREERERKERENSDVGSWQKDGVLSIRIGYSHIGLEKSTDVEVRIDPNVSGKKKVIWESSNTNVAKVDGDDSGARVTGINSGSATITATLYVDGNKRDWVATGVSVGSDYYGGGSSSGSNSSGGYAGVNGITVNTSYLTIFKGLAARVYAAVTPGNASNQGITFGSSNSYVAAVDAFGNVLGLNPGSAIITARSNEGGYTAIVNVVVVENASTDVTALNNQLALSAGRNPTFLYALASSVLTAPLGGTVPLTAIMPMSFDLNVVNALRMRPDVSILATFPYQGHMVTMAVPAGFDLTPYLDNGYADWSVLMTKKTGLPVIYLN